MARQRQSALGAWTRRIMPATLSGRLVATFVLLTTLTVLITVGLTLVATALQVSAGREERTVDVLDALSSYLQSRTDSLRLAVTDVADDPDVAAAVSAPGPATRLPHAERLLRSEGAAGYVLRDSSGSVVSSGGDAGVTAALVRLSQRASLHGGLVPAGSGLLLVAGDEVAVAGGTSATLVAAWAFGPEEIERYNRMSADAVVSVGPLVSPRGERVPAQTAVAFRDVRIVAQTPLTIEAAVLGAEGERVASVRITDADPRVSGARTIAQVASAITGLAAIALSAGIGVWLSGVIRKPIDTMVTHVTTRGYLAAEGAPYASGPASDEADLPIEFRELGAVFDDLLAHLSDRQAELKSAVGKAAYSEETLGIIVNESPEAKLVLEDGRVIIANPAAAVMVGQPAGVQLEQSLTATFRGSTLSAEDGSPREPAEVLEQALSDTVTVRVARPDQPERWYSVQAVRHADDLHNRIVLTGHDITEERRLQGIRSEIVSLVSHDLRAPLSVVIGYLDLLAKDLTDAERERAIGAARRNAGKMADLLEDLLSATRAEELLAPASLLPVPIADVAEEVVASLGPMQPERELLLDLQCRPVVLGEERRISQALVNLVTNAFKYSPPNKPITIRVSCGDGRAVLAVEDHGPGIPAKERGRIFERFERLEEGKDRPGVGLGLYIVRIITENHGGGVRVEKTPGGGATFVMELPLAGASSGTGVRMGATECLSPAHEPACGCESADTA